MYVCCAHGQGPRTDARRGSSHYEAEYGTKPRYGFKFSLFGASSSLSFPRIGNSPPADGYKNVQVRLESKDSEEHRSFKLFARPFHPPHRPEPCNRPTQDPRESTRRGYMMSMMLGNPERSDRLDKVFDCFERIFGISERSLFHSPGEDGGSFDRRLDRIFGVLERLDKLFFSVLDRIGGRLERIEERSRGVDEPFDLGELLDRFEKKLDDLEHNIRTKRRYKPLAKMMDRIDRDNKRRSGGIFGETTTYEYEHWSVSGDQDCDSLLDIVSAPGSDLDDASIRETVRVESGLVSDIRHIVKAIRSIVRED